MQKISSENSLPLPRNRKNKHWRQLWRHWPCLLKPKFF